MFIQIKADLQNINNTLNNFDVSLPKLTKRVLGKAGLGGKTAIKKSYGSYFKKRTGSLFKATMYKVRRSGNSVVIYSPATNDGLKKGFRYGFSLAFGANIIAKNTNYLTFMNEKGEWRKVKSVHLPAKSWVETPVESYLKSNKYNEDIESILKKQLDEYFK